MLRAMARSLPLTQCDTDENAITLTDMNMGGNETSRFVARVGGGDTDVGHRARCVWARCTASAVARVVSHRRAFVGN